MIYENDIEIYNFLKLDNIDIEIDYNFFDINFKPFHSSKLNRKYRKNIIKVCLRLIKYFGFSLDDNLKPSLNNVSHGTYSELRYSRISKIINFLYGLKLNKLEKMFRDIYNLFPQRDIKGLNYCDNSCYIDTILQCIFAPENDEISKHILKRDINTIKDLICCKRNIRQEIQKELNEIKISISGLKQVENCLKLKKLLYHCKGSEKFHTFNTQDASEFLLFLFNIFDVNTTNRLRKTYVSNDITDNKNTLLVSKVKYTHGPIVNIPVTVLNNSKEYKLIDSLNLTEDTVFDKYNMYKYNDELFCRRIELNKVIHATFIVFNINRLDINGKKNHTKIIFPRSFIISENELFLNAICIHNRNHYTCYYKVETLWYYYNDINDEKDVCIGTYEELLEIQDIQKNSTLFFYS